MEGRGRGLPSVIAPSPFLHSLARVNLTCIFIFEGDSLVFETAVLPPPS